VTVAEGAVAVVVVVAVVGGAVVVGAAVAMADVPSPGLSIAGSKTSEGSEIVDADVDAAGCNTGDDADAVFLATVVRNSGATYTSDVDALVDFAGGLANGLFFGRDDVIHGSSSGRRCRVYSPPK